MIGQEDPAAREIRRRTAELLRGRLDPDSGLVDRFLNWLGRLLSGGSPAGGGFSAGAAQVVSWVVLAVLLAALGALVVLAVRRGGWRRRRSDAVEITEEAEDRSSAEWGEAAAAHERAGRWLEALRCRFGQLVADLAERGVVSGAVGRTTGELSAEVAAALPDAAGAFGELCEQFEWGYYGGRPVTRAELAMGRARAEAVSGLARSRTPGPTAPGDGEGVGEGDAAVSGGGRLR